MGSLSTPQVHAALGSAVVAVGAFFAWDQLSLYGAGLVFAVTFGILVWRGTTIGLIWAWSTLFLGIESFLWPIITMVQIRSAATQPSDEQMGTILSAVLMGLFSAVFWMAFSYGLFRRAATSEAASSDSFETDRAVARHPSRKKR